MTMHVVRQQPDFNFCRFQRLVNNVGGIGPYQAYPSKARFIGDRLTQYGFKYDFEHEYNEIDEMSIPRGAGVYAITAINVYHRETGTETGYGHLMYIGSARNIAARVTQPTHWWAKCMRRLDKVDRMVWLHVLLTDDYKWVEKCLIRELRPWLNIQHNG